MSTYLKGLAPAAGAHMDAGRAPSVVLDAAPLLASEDVIASTGSAFWPALGYLVGLEAGAEVPLVTGLNGVLTPSRDDLKAFSAAFGTTGAAPLFHIEGLTPEAPEGCARPPLETRALTVERFAKAWCTLDSAGGDGGDESADAVDLIALGNPHLSITECAEIARLCDEVGKRSTKDGPGPRVIATLGRNVLEQAQKRGYAATMESFGVEFVTDTCWCMLNNPVTDTLAAAPSAILTPSGKFAHYAPGLTGRLVRFSSLERCLVAAKTARAPRRPAFVVAAIAKAMATSYS